MDVYKIISRVLAIIFTMGVIGGLSSSGSTFPLAVILLFVFIYFGWVHKRKNNEKK
tara:strand:+ start:431 stop:598 length:168 start_codon:yes stop_codon:yes gene_type:complete